MSNIVHPQRHDGPTHLEARVAAGTFTNPDGSPYVPQDPPADSLFNRVPPNDLEAEAAVLGSLLVSGTPNTSSARYFDEILDTGLVAEEYYRPAHTTIHRAICAVREAGEPVDPVTVGNKLTELGELTKVGGAAYLHTLVQAVPTAANGEYYAEIVRAKAYKRRAGEAANRILQYVYSGEGDEHEVRDLVEQQLTEIVSDIPDMQEAPPLVGDLYLDFVAELEEVQDGRRVGLTYGLADLDTITSGMRPGNVTVIAAGSGLGKSTLALNAAVAAAKAGAKVMFSSLEMSKFELMSKVTAAEGKLALHHITKKGGLTKEGWDTVKRLGPDLFRSLPLRVYRPEGAALGDILSTARSCVRADGLDVLVVDYLQLVEVETNRNTSREQAVASVSRGLKNLSVQLDCHVIALSQINDEGLMRESRTIKNDASVVIKVERPDLEREGSARSGEVDLIIEKNRFGPTATVSAAAQLHFSRFVDMASEPF